MRLDDETVVSSPTPSAIMISRAATCRILQHLERAIDETLGASLAASPYRALLLNIYLAEIEGRTIFQASLSTDEAASKPHRRSIKLAQLGAVIREPDPQDRRRTDLRLTPMAKQALDQAMDKVEALYSKAVNELKDNISDN
jgi:hypothetical protein